MKISSQNRKPKGSFVTLALLLSTAGLLDGCGGGGGGTTANVATTPSVGGSTGATSPQDVPTSPTAPVVVVPESSVVVAPDTLDLTPAWTQSTGTSIATFDASPDTVAAWGFRPGSEFPGASGLLSQTTGVGNGNAARVSYDLGCSTASVAVRGTEICGKYVAMAITMSSPIAVPSGLIPVLAFDTRNPQGVVNPMVRVLDSTGQTLQFSALARTLESSTGESWQRVHLPISKSANYFGGANDGVMHPPIRSVTLGASDFSQLQPAGSVDFDNISVLTSPTYSFELKPLAPVAAGTFYPSYVGRLSANAYVGDVTAYDKALAVGINVVRRDLFWSTIEANGVFDFSTYNAIAETLRAKGMSVLWILDYGHADHGGGAPLTDANRTAFANFARAAALNFKGKNVVGFEIWNEPNGSHFWASPDPIAYASLFTKTATAIRAADPSVKIISGGTGGIDMNYSIKFASNIQAGLIDAFAVHPYSKPAPEGFANNYAPLKNALASKSIDKPIWDTEWGYSSYGDFSATEYGNGYATAARNRQAILVLRRVLTDLALNIPFMNIYSLTDYGTDPVDREANFGVLTKTAEDKPSIVALRSLYAAQSGRIFKGFLPDVPPGVHVLRWDGLTDKAFVIWSDTVDQKVSVSLPSKLKTATWWNTTPATIVTVGSTQTLSLEEKDGPVFVTVNR